LLGLFLLGTLDRRATPVGALAGMIAGLASILCVLRFTQVAFTWYVFIGASVTFAVGAIFSRVLRPEQNGSDGSARVAMQSRAW